MSAWIGPIGGLVEVLQYKGSLKVASARPMNSKTTLGGRVKVQRGAMPRRVWDASVDGVSPAEVAGLLSLESAGVPPWVWVEPYAQVTNLFTPEQSVLLPGTWSGVGTFDSLPATTGGSVTVDGNTVPRSVLHPTGGTIDFGYTAGAVDRPVAIPGVPLTLSAYARGAGSLRIQWRNFANQTISEQSRAYNHAELARVSMANVTPPDGTATVRVWVTGALQVAMPALSWTPGLMPWSPGRGCNRVVIEGLSEALEQVSATDPDGTWSSLSFTVREVG